MPHKAVLTRCNGREGLVYVKFALKIDFFQYGIFATPSGTNTDQAGAINYGEVQRWGIRL